MSFPPDSVDVKSAACVCGEINTRHCSVHGQGESAASSRDREIIEYVEKVYGGPMARRADWILAAERNGNNFQRHLRDSLIREIDAAV